MENEIQIELLKYMIVKGKKKVTLIEMLNDDKYSPSEHTVLDYKAKPFKIEDKVISISGDKGVVESIHDEIILVRRGLQKLSSIHQSKLYHYQKTT